MEQVKKLIEYFTQMEVLDIIGFGNILGVEEVDNFEDYVTNICEAFCKEGRLKRRQLLKLAKDVSKANKKLK